MSKYKESDYSLSYALQNIGDYFWRLYRDDLKAYAANRARKDIPQRIHDEWDHAAQCTPFGTDIRIEWALAIYDHGDWEKALSISVPSYNKQQALLEHEQPTKASVAVSEGMDTLEAHVEVQDLRQFHFIKAFVFRDQSTHLGANVLRRRGFCLAKGTGISAVLARMKQELTLRHGAVAEHGMQLADVGLRDARCGCINDVADTGNVVVSLD